MTWMMTEPPGHGSLSHFPSLPLSMPLERKIRHRHATFPRHLDADHSPVQSHGLTPFFGVTGKRIAQSKLSQKGGFLRQTDSVSERPGAVSSGTPQPVSESSSHFLS